MPIPNHIKKSLENLTYQGEHLSLCSCGLDDKEVEKLVNLLMEIPSITSLDLERNNIFDAGAKLLAKLPTLKRLNLTLNHVHDEGAIELSKSKSLRLLNLRHNGLGEVGALAIIRDSKCEEIDLEGNSEVSAFLQDVRMADPDIENKMKISTINPMGKQDHEYTKILFHARRTNVMPGLDDMLKDVDKIAVADPKPDPAPKVG